MLDFKDIISNNIGNITGIEKEKIYEFIEIPPDSNMGDYSFPCFRLAKELKKSPVEIANDIKDKYVLDEHIKKVDVINGYLNFFINTTSFITEVLKEAYITDNYGASNIGKGNNAIVEYSSPNIAKPFHIGHLRSTVIGGALYNLYKYMGYNTIGINHLGDWGIQFGKVMAGVSLWGKEYDLDQEDPINEILKIYVRFSKEEKENEELSLLARQWFIKLEEGDEEATKLWAWIKDKSLKNYAKTYETLNSHFDSYNGEAFYNDKMEAIVDELDEKGLLVDSQGARIVDLEQYNMPPCIIKTSAGTTIYATRDLAAFKYRIDTYHFDKMVYVVGGEQKLHFNQIFKVMELMGYKEYVDKTQHIPFGLIVDKTGEKIGSRKGNSVSLDEIIEEAINKAYKIIEEKNPQLENKEEIAKKIGVGAIIFNDLSNSRIKDEIFDWDMILNFNGETGPYVQFMYVRTRSILEKANIDLDINNVDLTLLKEKEEFELAKTIYKLQDILINAIEKNEPSILTRYIVDLAQQFSSYYAKYTIMCEDENLRKARLVLTDIVGKIIKNGMGILGIECPEKM